MSACHGRSLLALGDDQQRDSTGEIPRGFLVGRFGLRLDKDMRCFYSHSAAYLPRCINSHGNLLAPSTNSTKEHHHQHGPLPRRPPFLLPAFHLRTIIAIWFGGIGRNPCCLSISCFNHYSHPPCSTTTPADISLQCLASWSSHDYADLLSRSEARQAQLWVSRLGGVVRLVVIVALSR